MYCTLVLCYTIETPILMAHNLNFPQVLVGESIVKQSDPGKGISNLFGKDISI